MLGRAEKIYIEWDVEWGDWKVYDLGELGWGFMV